MDGPSSGGETGESSLPPKEYKKEEFLGTIKDALACWRERGLGLGVQLADSQNVTAILEEASGGNFSIETSASIKKDGLATGLVISSPDIAHKDNFTIEETLTHIRVWVARFEQHEFLGELGPPYDNKSFIFSINNPQARRETKVMITHIPDPTASSPVISIDAKETAQVEDKYGWKITTTKEFKADKPLSKS